MLLVKIGKDESQQKNRVVESAVIDFVEIKNKIDELNVQLKGSKEVIVEAAKKIIEEDEVSTITFGVDDDKVKISFGFDVKVKDEEKLLKLLGDRFDDLVTTTVGYKPDNKLKEMALCDDGLKECLTVKEKAPAFSIVK